MSGMTRRGFVSSMGAAAASMGLMGAAGAATTAVAEEATANGFVPGGGSFAEGMLDLGWTGTPVELEQLGVSTMPLAELNRRRKAYIDSKTEDHICEDGTVVPVVFVKAAAKLNTIGTGTLGSAANGAFPDTAFLALRTDLNEEQAAFYIDLPADVNFNIVDATIATGRSIEECEAFLEHLWSRGYLAKHERNDGFVYHLFPFFQGLIEMYLLNHDLRAEKSSVNPEGLATASPGDFAAAVLECGVPVFHSVPCDKSVVAEGARILPYDDVREIIKTKKTLSLGPCVCRWRKARAAGSTTLPSWEDFIAQAPGCKEYYDETIGQYIENCIYMDDEAENGIAMGWAHPATPEEVLESLERSAREGYILNAAGGTRCETICCCSVDAGCAICGSFAAMGAAASQLVSYEQESRYELVVDLDFCIGCGTCVTRCPMYAIEMGEDGKPVISGACLRCGQCGATCPVEARKLVDRPEGTWPELPNNFVEDYMIKAAYRFEHGMII